jgi:hypothetical protein
MLWLQRSGERRHLLEILVSRKPEKNDRKLLTNHYSQLLYMKITDNWDNENNEIL